jgi:hypothetical protein
LEQVPASALESQQDCAFRIDKKVQQQSLRRPPPGKAASLF